MFIWDFIAVSFYEWTKPNRFIKLVIDLWSYKIEGVPFIESNIKWIFTFCVFKSKEWTFNISFLIG